MRRRPAMLAVLLAGAALTGCYAETLPATNVTATSAVLHARGHTDSAPATVFFEYAPSSVGLDSAQSPFRTPKRSIAPNTPGPGKPDVEFHVAVKALQPGTSYDFRVCGGDETNPNRTTYDCAGTRRFTTPAGNPAVDFVAHPAFPISSSTFPRFGAADFNSDGKLDIALSERSIGTALGQGNLRFSGPVMSPLDGSGSSLVLGDFNRDGRTDAALDGHARLGDGTGRFGNGQGSQAACPHRIGPTSTTTGCRTWSASGHPGRFPRACCSARATGPSARRTCSRALPNWSRTSTATASPTSSSSTTTPGRPACCSTPRPDGRCA